MLPLVVIVVCTPILGRVRRRTRTDDPELRAAIHLRAPWLPLGALVVGGGSYLMHHDLWDAVTNGAGFLIGGLVVSAVRYRHLSARARRAEASTDSRD